MLLIWRSDIWYYYNKSIITCLVTPIRLAFFSPYFFFFRFINIASPPLIKIDTAAHVIFGIGNARRETHFAGGSRAVRRRFINVNGLISPRASRRNAITKGPVKRYRVSEGRRTPITEIKNAIRWTMPYICIIYGFIFVPARPSIRDKRMMDDV